MPRRDEDFSGRLPNGQGTTSAKDYLAAWDALAQPLQDALGLKAQSFDPTITFRTPMGQTVQLPVWFVERINAVIQGLRPQPLPVPTCRMCKKALNDNHRCPDEKCGFFLHDQHCGQGWRDTAYFYQLDPTCRCAKR